MQVLAGDVDLAQEAFAAFLSLWRRFGLLPERFLLDSAGGSIHPLEQYYPLRPELMESAFYLYQVQDISHVRDRLSVQSPPCSLMHRTGNGPLNSPVTTTFAGTSSAARFRLQATTKMPDGWTLR